MAAAPLVFLSHFPFPFIRFLFLQNNYNCLTESEGTNFLSLWTVATIDVMLYVICIEITSEIGLQLFLHSLPHLYLVFTTIKTVFPSSFVSYAVIAFGCASCPKITCGREGCGTEFCYHCKQLWHPNQTCDTARQQRAQNLRLRSFRSSSLSYSQESGAAGNMHVDIWTQMNKD